jgi:hypothetical protein
MPSAAGVIDYFLRPKFGFMTSSTTSPSVVANPITGRGNVLAASAGLASSFGIVYAVSLAPPFAGRSVATFVQYEDLALELWVQHTLASGLVICTQHVQTREQNGIILWENLLPSTVLLDVFPNFQVTVEWLVGV